ncbi:MAG: helix-turn-helix domain-containing protein [Ruminococcus sp.]|nr:helix-turn-helix domain-containing protein [Ruminococcus sp.]
MKIKELRFRTGLSQQKFADKYGLGKWNVTRWESEDTNPPQYVLSLLERVIKEDEKVEKWKIRGVLSPTSLEELGYIYGYCCSLLDLDVENVWEWVADPFNSFTDIVKKVQDKMTKGLDEKLTDFLSHVDSDDWSEAAKQPVPEDDKISLLIGFSRGRKDGAADDDSPSEGD